MGRRDDKARIADLEMKPRWADQYGHCMMEARVRFIYARRGRGRGNETPKSIVGWEWVLAVLAYPPMYGEAKANYFV